MGAPLGSEAERVESEKVPYAMEWNQTGPARTADLIRQVGIMRLGNWDGCCCSNFSVRDVNVDIACGKGRNQGIWVWSNSCEYAGEADLRPIMDEVAAQLIKYSGRGGTFKQHFRPWQSSDDE